MSYFKDILSGLQKERDKENTLIHLYQHFSLLLKANRLLTLYLPSYLQPRCEIVHYRQNILVIAVDSANVKMLLGCQQGRLMHFFRTELFAELITIQMKVMPHLHQHTCSDHRVRSKREIKSAPTNNAVKLSQNTVLSLQKMAAHYHATGKIVHHLENLAGLIEGRINAL